MMPGIEAGTTGTSPEVNTNYTTAVQSQQEHIVMWQLILESLERLR
jgi:hypothetical protein